MVVEIHIAFEVGFKMEAQHSHCGIYVLGAGTADMCPERGDSTFVRNVGYKPPVDVVP
jgi:hypothetical protein